MKTRHALEMTKGFTLIHVIPLVDGTFLGEDVYNGRKNGLRFNNYAHLKNFATKFNYTITRIRNT